MFGGGELAPSWFDATAQDGGAVAELHIRANQARRQAEARTRRGF